MNSASGNIAPFESAGKEFKPGFVIPVYRHGETALQIASRLSKRNLPVILVDDGNGEKEKALLANAAEIPGATIAANKKNLGKGGAVLRGLAEAKNAGLTHALQIDADGQHDETQIDFFLSEAKSNPDNIICGCPEFDESAPAIRLKGRRIANFWANTATLSHDLIDVFCGFRVYPVEKTLRAAKTPFIDRRMGFDAEILVRLYWGGTMPIFHPVKVVYPEGGISNYRYVRDNLNVVWTFFRLFFGMIPRAPMLIARRKNLSRTTRTGRNTRKGISD
jgi:glycosyltransferase involved in cell wall biosynthesis